MFVSFCNRALCGGVRRQNVHAMLAPKHLVFIPFDVRITHLCGFCREIPSHCSSTDCTVESTVANLWTSLKNVISAIFYIFIVIMVMIEVVGCVMLCHLVNLLPSALQPAVGFGLSNNILPLILTVTKSVYILTPNT